MATVPGQLIWEIVKKNNSFLVKEFGNNTQSVQFSRESNNLYNLNSFKYSGLANKKTVTIQPAGKDQAVLLATTKSRKQNKPSAISHKSILKKEFSRLAKAVQNQVADNYYRPDLKKAALARERRMEAARRVMWRLRVVPLLKFSNGVVTASSSGSKIVPVLNMNCLRLSSALFSSSSLGWLSGTKRVNKSPPIVKAGDPVLHEPAREVHLSEIKSEKVQNIIDDMIHVMRKSPGVGLAAPQIGIPFRIIVLEDKKEYISYNTEEETKLQDRRPFDLLVILNPKLKKKSNKTAFFFEGCLSVDRYQAMVERYLDVEVAGFDRNGEPIKINASGWQARILQHECDHLDGTLYVDKMVPRTFRSWKNMDLPLAHGCPKLGPRA